MLLTKVILENYGVFRDRHEFDFDCSNEKPIILIGGKNGAGKTTFFESIMLCLYGASFFEKKITRKEYDQFLSGKTHRYLGTKAISDHTSITVAFNFYHQGKEERYSVTRGWYSEDGRIVEEFSVKVNGKPLDDVEQSEWQSFIEGLIPRGISKLFFFDGEKIQKIAEEGSEDIEIKSSFDTLLGLDLVEQLQSDIRIYVTRQLGVKDKEISERLDQMLKEKSEITKTNELHTENVASIRFEIEDTTKQIQKLESKIATMGGGYASKRDEFKVRKAELEARLSVVESRIRELCAGLLPFCLIPKEIRTVEKQLELDQEILKQGFEKEILEKNFVEIKSDVASHDFWSKIGASDKIRKTIMSRLEEIFEEKINSEKSKDHGVINFSTIETAQILAQIEKIENEIPKQLEKDIVEFNGITSEWKKMNTGLKVAPKDDEIGPLVSELNSLHEKIGSLKKEEEHINQKISTNNSLLKILSAKIKSLVDEKHKAEKIAGNMELADKVQKTLDEYGHRLKEKKLQLLEQYLLESLDILLHKTNFIDKVSISSETFEIKLYQKDGNQIDKEFLSKGEKQMLATSVLWALAKTSGKPLPFIIDTPLARLDLEHRDNLIEKFFPLAAHQVVIFSTNSEIDEKYYKKLKPYISNSYLISFVSEEGKTDVRKGYFWDEREGIIAI